MSHKPLAVRIVAVICAICVTMILIWLTTSVVWAVSVRGDFPSLLLVYACLATPLALLLFFLVRTLKTPPIAARPKSPAATTPSATPSATPPAMPSAPATPLAAEDDRCYKCGAYSPGGSLCEDCSFDQFRESCER